MPKPDPKALKAFHALVAQAPGARVKPMFGNFAAFANEQMFAGVFGEAVFVRLGDDDRTDALAVPGSRLFEPMKGRPMREYVVLPPAVLQDKKKSQAWVDKSLAHVASMPPKKAKAKARNAKVRK